MCCSAEVMSVHDDDIINFQGKTIVSPTEHTPEDPTPGPESASSPRPAKA